jgi:hypothetical protein
MYCIIVTFDQACPALRIGAGKATLFMGMHGMYSFTNRTPSHFPLAGKTKIIFEIEHIAAFTLEFFHWFV